jgi:ABC-type branched-subunit amino acid transport system ATPase component
VVGAPSLECRDIWKRFGGFTALEGVSLTIQPGEVVGIAGPNGAGKTTLFDVISGRVRASRGDVTLGGRVVTRLPAHRRARLGLARTFQSPLVFSNLTVAQALEAARFAYRPPVSRAEVDRARAIVRLEVDEVTLSESLGTLDRRKLLIASLTMRNPSVLLLDEPCSGLLQEEIDEIVGVIQDIAAGSAIAICVVEHRLEFLAAVADRVVVMDAGTVIAEGEPSRIFHDPVVKAAYFEGLEP